MTYKEKEMRRLNRQAEKLEKDLRFNEGRKEKLPDKIGLIRNELQRLYNQKHLAGRLMI